MKRTLKILLPLLCIALFSGTAHAAFTITRTSSPIHYVDSGITPAPTGMYAAYSIVSTTNITDAWVRIENFSSASLGLAPNETGIVHLGPMTANVPMMAYFYLTGTATGTAQTHNVMVYDRLPTAPGAVNLATQGFTVNSVSETIQANPNVVTALVSGPTPPTLGGIVTITVSGSTGTIGSAPGPNGPLVFTPAAFANWPANAFQLFATSITFSGGNTGTYYDTLYFASLPNSSTTNYTAVYSFRAMSVTSAPTAVSPVAYLASGGQMKHTALDSQYYALAALSPIQPATNTLMMSKNVNVSTLPNAGGTVTYTLRLMNNSSTYSANLDSITDALPSSPASASYVAGSSTYNGSPIGDPVASGANRSWYQLFVIPPSSFRDLVFQATLPDTSGTYTNSAVGIVGQSTVIDTTITTADYAPATASTIVLAPPAIAKSFVPTSIGPAGTSTLTFTITNPNSTVAISGVAFIDVLPVAPAAMTLSSPSTTNTCGGTLTDTGGNPLVAGSASVKLSGGSIAAGGSCSITVSVTAATPGTYNNTSGAVSSTNAGTGATASASLTVSNKPSITKSIVPAAIPTGGTSTLTLIISNNLAAPLTGVTFTDTFPVSPGAMTAAAPLTTTSTCGGSLTDDTGGALAAGSPGIRLNNGTVPASGTCTITIAVTASVSGTYSNTSGGVASNETGAAGTGSNTALLTVLVPPTISKAFTPGTVAVNSPSTMTVTLTNPNAGAALTGVGFNDIFPVAPGAMTLTSAATTNTCGGTLTDNTDNPLAIGSASLKLSGGGIAAGDNCTVTVSVAAPATGTYANTTGNVTSTEGGSGGTASASLVIDLQPTFTKSFGPNPVLARGSSTLTFTITNNSTTSGLTNVAFTDVFPAFPGQMSLASATTTNTCGGTLTDNTGGAIGIGDVGIRLTNGAVALGGSCTITVSVRTLVGGRFDNTTSTLTSSGPAANPASAPLNVYTLSKLFNPNPILPTGTSTLRLSVTNPDTGGSITGVGFSDIFPAAPAQMSLASATTSNTCGGTLTDNANNPLAVGSTSVKLVGGSVGPNTDCVVLVTVKANTATAGTYTNTAGIDSTDSLVLTLAPTAAKSFAPATIAVNGTSTMTIVLTNNTALGALTNVAFTDTFPAGLVVTGTPNLTNTCGGTISGGTAGASYLNLSGGTIPAGAAGTCTITVSVTSATGGTYNNATSGVSSTQSGPPGPVSNTATLLVQISAPGATKTFNPSGIAQNDPSQMTIAFSNPNASNITGVAFTDTYPAGLMNAPAGAVVASNTCGGVVTAANSGTSLSLSGGAIPVAGCSIVVNVTATALGDKVNSTGNITSSNAVTNTGVSGTLAVVSRLAVAKSFFPSTTGVGNASVLTITLTNPNTLDITGAAFSDAYPANLVNTATPAGATTCGAGAVTAPANGGYVSLSSGTVPAGGSCTVMVNVTSAAAGVYANSTGTVTTANAGTGSPASATLTVVVLPNIVALKFVTVQSDPVNGTVNPKAIPGAAMLYTVTTTNQGGGAADADSVVVTDPVPANTELFVNDLGGAGSGPVLFSNGATPSGLSYSFINLGSGADNIAFSSDSGATWTYTPVPDGNGYDANVTNIRVSPSGAFNGAAGPNQPSFNLQFQVRVK